MQALSQAAMKLGEVMYKAQQESAKDADAAAGSESAAEGAKDDSTVVDAEFEEVDDEKKKSAKG
jgi:molecular chaperone DnaK